MYPAVRTLLLHCMQGICAFFFHIFFFSNEYIQSGTEASVEEWLKKKYEGLICRISREKKEDLKVPNHLMGHRRLFLQLCFHNISDLLTVRRDILPLAQANSAKRDAVDAYAEVIRETAAMDIDIEDEAWATSAQPGRGGAGRDSDPWEGIIDIRQYDLPLPVTHFCAGGSLPRAHHHAKQTRRCTRQYVRRSFACL